MVGQDSFFVCVDLRIFFSREKVKNQFHVTRKVSITPKKSGEKQTSPIFFGLTPNRQFFFWPNEDSLTLMCVTHCFTHPEEVHDLHVLLMFSSLNDLTGCLLFIHSYTPTPRGITHCTRAVLPLCVFKGTNSVIQIAL